LDCFVLHRGGGERYDDRKPSLARLNAMQPIKRLFERLAPRLLIIVAALCVTSTVARAFVPPTQGGNWGSPLVLIAVWSSLGTTTWFVRWPCAAAAFWLAARPLHVDSARLVLAKLYLAWEILPHVLLTFTVLCCLRASGISIRPATWQPAPFLARQFNLRKMFAWVAGAAAISLGWKYLLDSAHGVDWPRTFGAGKIFIEGASHSVSIMLIDLTAVYVTLRAPRLRWSHASLVIVAMLMQTVVWRFSALLVFGISQLWWQDFVYVCWYDAFYLPPLLTGLLLARAAGYRLSSALPRAKAADASPAKAG
jgi:hypothetical protein